MSSEEGILDKYPKLAPSKKLLRVCLRCSRKFMASAYNAKRGWGKFCSNSCARQKPFVAKNRHPNTPAGSKVIPLTQGEYAIVDAEDYEWLNQWKWTYRNGNYAFRVVKEVTAGISKQITVFMHSLLVTAASGLQVDHINRNKLDNRKANLRVVTSSQNAFNSPTRKDNTSGVKGVNWHKKSNKWRAYIMLNQKSIHLGTFEVFEDAVRARKAGEEKYICYE